MILGTTVEAILKERAGPVLVVKRRARDGYRTVLVGTDFSDASRAAIQAASALFPQARLTVLHAYHAPGLAGTGENDDAAYRRALDDCGKFVAATLPAAPRAIRCVAEAGIPEALLNRYATDKKIDLLAVGTHGRHPMLDLLLGSTCAALIRSSRADTLLVPRRTDASPADGVA
jgi:nucleotide-binding universal stress UspA family protein